MEKCRILYMHSKFFFRLSEKLIVAYLVIITTIIDYFRRKPFDHHLVFFRFFAKNKRNTSNEAGVFCFCPL